ncbi:hypothetical protein CW676_07785 [Macrococcoides caseolyticum]|uniref:RHS repeat-associated core domain-containing protein n=2 Tax=Macrococcoides caseolyticum TaxID=69966 RepID=UPI000C346ECB|nr:RHS repeat-associated core domain-containing protein [Macrococcus caseolyticus]PKE06432.1 hypothetical protein CW692_08335 [Macrococcus caseolyticus]PKE23555.1 hypothetical protein CW689_08415 [Macrococcus caseolyticus]PKE52893.1 hypothetical protein CW676_07785 [Macrococcus caseolyticus]PKF37887.1 hypothetical protein CW681_09670 [Macrococcus caseolyticus]
MMKKDVKDDKVKGQPLRYASCFFNEESEQYCLMARYYHPKQGVFLSVDPEISGDESVTMNSGYAYANNNPIKNIDADGKWFWAAAVGAWGAYDGHRWAKKRGYTGWRYYGSVAAGAAWGATGGKYIGKAVKWGYKAAQTYRFKRNYNRMSIANKYSYQRYQAVNWNTKVRGHYKGDVPFKNHERKLSRRGNYREYDAHYTIKRNRGRERFVVHH